MMAGGGFRDNSAAMIQRNGLPHRRINVSRSQTNLQQAGLTSHEIDIETIKSSVWRSEAPAGRPSDRYFVPASSSSNGNRLGTVAVSAQQQQQQQQHLSSSYMTSNRYTSGHYTSSGGHGQALQDYRSIPLHTSREISFAAPPPYAALTQDNFMVSGTRFADRSIK